MSESEELDHFLEFGLTPTLIEVQKAKTLARAKKSFPERYAHVEELEAGDFAKLALYFYMNAALKGAPKMQQVLTTALKDSW